MTAFLNGIPVAVAPAAHDTTHEDTGGDEVSVVGLSGLLADDQHVLDAEALAAAVQSGAITNGVTKAPTHDAVFDVKATADAAQTAAEVDADIATHAAIATVHQDAPALIATHAAIVAAHHAQGSATKEFFVPATFGTTPAIKASYPGFTIDGGGVRAAVFFGVPNDFSSITDAVFVVAANSTKTHRLSLVGGYGQTGEGYLTHNESVNNIDTVMTSDNLYEIDITGALSALAANDYVSARIEGEVTNTPNIHVLGIRFKYS